MNYLAHSSNELPSKRFCQNLSRIRKKAKKESTKIFKLPNNVEKKLTQHNNNISPSHLLNFCQNIKCFTVELFRRFCKIDYYLHPVYLSVCPSAWYNSAPTGRIFMKCWYLRIFMKCWYLRIFMKCWYLRIFRKSIEEH